MNMHSLWPCICASSHLAKCHYYYSCCASFSSPSWITYWQSVFVWLVGWFCFLNSVRGSGSWTLGEALVAGQNEELLKSILLPGVVGFTSDLKAGVCWHWRSSIPRVQNGTLFLQERMVEGKSISPHFPFRALPLPRHWCLGSLRPSHPRGFMWLQATSGELPVPLETFF